MGCGEWEGVTVCHDITINSEGRLLSRYEIGDKRDDLGDGGRDFNVLDGGQFVVAWANIGAAIAEASYSGATIGDAAIEVGDGDV